MHTALNGCGCRPGDQACAELPPEFVRVRYYYGQRLGVMELNDEAAYHAGKHAFHNARLHGVGVVCGLIAERYLVAPATQTTVLRVHRGVALDSCGREVVVGVDQCIDVAAWFARNRQRPGLAGWVAGSQQQLIVAVRYRECPSDPALAPRDPCGCDNGGCELARIREGFELSLLLPSEVQCATQIFPDPAALATAVAGGGPAGQLNVAIAGLVGSDCPEPASDTWLCLSAVTVVLDATTGVPVDLGPIDNAPPGRATLLATSALQSLLLGLTLAAGNAGAGLSGPIATDLSFTQGTPAANGTLTLAIGLVSSGSPAVTDPISAATFQTGFVTLVRFDTGNWNDITPPAAGIALTAAAASITVDMAGQVISGATYRLVVDQPVATPIADTKGRPLQPLRLVRQFTLAPDSAGNLQVVPST